jgi:hypothetical protein
LSQYLGNFTHFCHNIYFHCLGRHSETWSQSCDVCRGEFLNEFSRLQKSWRLRVLAGSFSENECRR